MTNILQRKISVQTSGRGTYEITHQLKQVITECGLETGLCHAFIQHTSASLIVCENADASVRKDLERFMTRLVPDGDPLFTHVTEGDDDMPAHVRSILTHASVTIPVADGILLTGTWQGIYLWEHRTMPHSRKIVVTLQGDRSS